MDELKHYGVLGMRWGIRKYQDDNGNYTAEGKKRYIEDETAGLRKTKSSFEEKGRTRKANRISRKIEKLTKKLSRKFDFEKNLSEIEKETTLDEKMIFSESTRRAAAKYVTDNNMTISDARKRAKREAIINTAIILSAMGGYYYYKSKQPRSFGK